MISQSQKVCVGPEYYFETSCHKFTGKDIVNLNCAPVTLRQHHWPKQFCLGETGWDMCDTAQPPCLALMPLHTKPMSRN